MRKFKLFMASFLTYLMVMSILPTSLLETVVKAAENEYTTLVKSDYYLRAEAQYYNKTLIAYGDAKDSNGKGKIIISTVENGNETVLKEIEGYTDIRLYEKKGSIIGIRVFKEYENYDEKNNIFETIDLRTNKFSEISYDELKKFIPEFNYDYTPVKPIEDKDELEKILNKINSKTGAKLTILDKVLSSNEYETGYSNGKETIRFNVYPDNSLNGLIRFGIYSENRDENNEIKTNYYAGLIYKDYTFVKVFKYYERDQYMTYIVGDSLYIWDKISDNNEYNLIRIDDGKLVSSGKITLEEGVYPNLRVSDDKIYVIYYGNVYIYRLRNNEYKLENNISTIPYSIRFNEDNIFALELSEEKIFISEIKDISTHKIIDITDAYNNISSNLNDGLMNFKVFNENNMIVTTLKGFVIVQKQGQQTFPENPEQPQEPTNPGNNDGNVVVTPSNGKVVAEVSKINPHEKNEIVVKTDSEAKNVEVVLKDIEALKSGEGSLAISVNDNMKMNLPLSLIDAKLLEGATDVTIKLDILEGSDILKDKNAVNKVFDFNLIINREDGQVNVHNFKDGLAEVTLNLTDKDLEGLNKDNLVVYYYNDADKTFEAMETSVDGNKVTFKTSHFSKYVIAEKIEENNEAESPSVDPSTGSNDTSSNNAEAGKGNLPETGARVSSTTIFVLALGMMIIGGAMFFRKRRHA